MSSRRGFTFLEITAVLILVGLAAALVIPAISRGTGAVEVRLARDQLGRDLKTARAEAIGKVREAGLVFPGGYIYRLNIGGQSIERRLPGGLAVTATGERSGVVFRPDGTCDRLELELTADGRRYRWEVREDGRLVW